MPLATRSQKSDSSSVRNTSDVENVSAPSNDPSLQTEVLGNIDNNTISSESKNETEERRDFHPPPSVASSSPAMANRELASSPERREVESEAMLGFPPPGASPTQRPSPPQKQSPSHPDQWQAIPQARPSSCTAGRPTPIRKQGGQQDASPYAQYAPQTSQQGSSRKPDFRRVSRREGGPGSSRRSRADEMKAVGSLGSIAAELDMAAKEQDDFGPSVADCLNLGSFGEESPSRGGDRKRASDAKPAVRVVEQKRPTRDPKGAPRQETGPFPAPFGPPPYPPMPGLIPNHLYQNSTYYPPKSDGGNPHPSPPPYASGFPGSGGNFPYITSPYAHAAYSSLPPPEPWSSPPGLPSQVNQGGSVQNSVLKASPPSRKRDWEQGEGADSSTPHKTPSKKSEGVLLGRSPFRSPLPSLEKGSAKKFKRSPLFGAGTPNIGYYGSFGMDTPGGTIDAAKLDEFSPMGPSFPAGFGEETTPFPLGGEAAAHESGIQFDPKLNINRVPSSDDGDAGSRKRPVIRQRKAGELTGSPFSSFLGDMSPLSGDIHLQGSPLGGPGRPDLARCGGAPEFNPMGSPQLDRNFVQAGSQPAIPSLSSKRGDDTKRHLLASPVASSGGKTAKKKKQPWFDRLAPSPGPVRLELGTVGMKPVETRKGLEGINSMVRGGSTPHHRGYDSRRPPSSAFRGDMSTPIKLESSKAAGGNRSAQEHSGGKMAFQGSAQEKHTPASGTKMYPPVPKSGGRGAVQTPAKNTASGKENASPKAQRRNPCNCKKSKCLKLYCECFAAELFCDKCNCSDCRNSPAHEAIRAKAIKDTRAKNPNAFKPRIALRPGSGPSGSTPPTGHNMGCRCKRSECLKKYCECFQAGVMCGNKCKCVECLNYVGSQPLIDKRRKIKDHKGAEFAMRTADDAWKGKHPPRPLHPLGAAVPSPAPGARPHPGHHMHIPPMIQPSPGHHGGPRAPTTGAPHPPYGIAPYPIGPPMGYSPMGMPPTVTPGYVTSKPPGGRGDMRRTGGLSAARGKFNPNLRQKQQTPRQATPRTPAVRLGFDPHSSKKKRKLSSDSKEEAVLDYFGPNVPAQSKTMALAIFSYLSNDDLYNAGIVCKRWSKLSLDDELWQF